MGKLFRKIIGRTPDGRPVRSDTWWMTYQFTDATGRRRQRRENTGKALKTHAAAMLDDREREARRGRGSALLHMDKTLADGARLIEADYRVNGKRIKRLMLSLAALKRIMGPDRRLAEILSSDLTEYRARRLTETSRYGRPPSHSSINRELAALKRIYTLAAQEWGIHGPAFPAAVSETNVRQGFLEDDTYPALKGYMASHYPRLTALLSVYYNLAQRLNEPLGYAWQGENPEGLTGWVDVEQGCIRLLRSVTKGKRGRVAYMPAELWAEMRRQKEQRDQEAPECPWVFYRPVGEGKGARIADFRGAWQAACAAVGLGWLEEREPVVVGGKKKRRKPLYRGLLVHDLRRTGARNKRRAGIPERLIMEEAGWKTRSVFDRYDIVDEADMRDARDRLDAHRLKNLQGRDSTKLSTGADPELESDSDISRKPLI